MAVHTISPKPILHAEEKRLRWENNKAVVAVLREAAFSILTCIKIGPDFQPSCVFTTSSLLSLLCVDFASRHLELRTHENDLLLHI